jgi:hypothetical protein
MFGVVVSIVAKPTGARVDNGSMSGVQLEGISGVLGMKNKLTPIDENEMSFLRMACYSKMKMPIVGHIYLLVMHLLFCVRPLNVI